MSDFAVHVITDVTTDEVTVTEEHLDQLVDLLAAQAASVSLAHGRLTMQLSVDADRFGAAADVAEAVVTAALTECRLPVIGQVVSVEVLTEAEFDRRLADEHGFDRG